MIERMSQREMLVAAVRELGGGGPRAGYARTGFLTTVSSRIVSRCRFSLDGGREADYGTTKTTPSMAAG